MVQLIRNDNIFGTEQRLKETTIGVEATAVQNGVFETKERGDFRLQFLMNGLCGRR